MPHRPHTLLSPNPWRFYGRVSQPRRRRGGQIGYALAVLKAQAKTYQRIFNIISALGNIPAVCVGVSFILRKPVSPRAISFFNPHIHQAVALHAYQLYSGDRSLVRRSRRGPGAAAS